MGTTMSTPNRPPPALGRWALPALGLLLVACNKEPPRYEPVYAAQPASAEEAVLVFAVHPLHNPQKLASLYQPLVDHLNTQLPHGKLRLEASSSYAAFEEKLRRREVHLALPNPYQTVTAEAWGYRVLAKAANDADFRGIILVRKDRRIERPTDLRGQAISFPAPTALAATLLPQRWLHDQGLDLRRVELRYVGTQESSILNVALGETAAGATWPQAWRSFQADQPELASRLTVKWETGALVNNSIMVRDDVDPAVAQSLREALIGLTGEDAGRQVLRRLEISGFKAADSRTYDAVRDFLRDFERDVRKIEVARP
jgi:phosphonate transport system substrate-binding protein